jgi:hypothetical protein
VTDGPGAASVEEFTSDDSAIDESTSDDSTSDEDTTDDDATDDDATDDDATGGDVTDGESVLPGPLLVFRGELRRPDGLRPGRPMRDRPIRVHIHRGPGEAPVLVVRR